MTHTSSNKEEPETFEHMLTVVMIDFGDARELESSEDVADRNRAELKNDEAFRYAQGWLQEHDQLLLTQALKEIKEEVIGGVPSKMNTDNWKYDRRAAELKLWQHQAIDNKIKALEEV